MADFGTASGGSKVELYSTFSRHGRVDASITMLIWLNEKVELYSTFSRHGRVDASITLLIWLNEKVGISGLGYSNYRFISFSFNTSYDAKKK